MRKIVIVSVIVLIILAGVTSQAFSMGNKPLEKKKYFVEKYPQISQATGRVAKVDTGKPVIIISTKEDKSLIVAIDSKTELSKEGKNIKLSEIKKGNFVRVTYKIIYKDKNVAKSINIDPENMNESKKQYKK